MNLQIIGLFYDALGIVILGVIPVVNNSTSKMAGMAATKWNGNTELYENLCITRVDTAAGSILLLSGFAIQIASLLGYSATQIGAYSFFLGLVSFLAIYAAFLRKYSATKMIERVKKTR